jgi:hypothetical protein
MLIFFSTFILVFALGFQSLNVNNGHYKAAFFTSFAIAVSNLVLFKTVPQAGILEIGAYLIAGPFAIIASMYAHKKVIRHKSIDAEIDDVLSTNFSGNPVYQTQPETRKAGKS